MINKPTLVDLFSGCGGFGLGAELAGFHTVAAIDVDTTLQSAYKNNFPATNVITGDLSTMTKKDWNTILAGQTVDGVIGGPPCQGYSRIGAGDENDPRRKLLEHYFHHVNTINPKFFVMENVEGLLDSRNRAQLDKAIAIADKKYTIVGPFIIDASKCGAPTKRKRVIVIGYDASRMSKLTTEQFNFDEPVVTVADAISDLPKPIEQTKDTLDFGFADYPLKAKLSNYAKQMRRPAAPGMGLAQARTAAKQSKVSGLFTTIHSADVAKRYQDTPQGSTEKTSRSKKLAWDGFCPTLRAGTGSDKGSHQAVRPLHPEEGRVITVREAARLQGFPDWFTFHPTKWHSFRMIGNSVSPIVSRKILSIIYQALELKETLHKIA